MPVLSGAQVYALARKAGLGRSRAIVATAISGGSGSPVTGESGGDTMAHNAVPPDDSYGLWQINMIGVNGPYRRSQLGLKSNDQLFDPRTNARAMAMISAYGLSFLPWTVYTRGTYKANLGWATASANQADAAGIDNVIKGIGSGSFAQGLGEAAVGAGAGGLVGKATDQFALINTAIKWLSTAHNWWRIAGVIAGALLILVALFTILSPVLEPSTRAAVKAASRGLV